MTCQSQLPDRRPATVKVTADFRQQPNQTNAHRALASLFVKVRPHGPKPLKPGGGVAFERLLDRRACFCQSKNTSTLSDGFPSRQCSPKVVRQQYAYGLKITLAQTLLEDREDSLLEHKTEMLGVPKVLALGVTEHRLFGVLQLLRGLSSQVRRVGTGRRRASADDQQAGGQAGCRPRCSRTIIVNTLNH